MNYKDAMAYIGELGKLGSRLGLERIGQLMQLLGNPQDGLKFVHIAGTNGKGSTAAMTAAMLTEAGYKTGLYTSPYLYRFNERIKLDGVDISDRAITALTDKIKPLAESMLERSTAFEFVTAMAFEYFASQGCDIVVLEVGLGGRFDATNVIKAPLVCAITSIGIDHTELLGDTPEKIAFEKAGIIKTNATAVLYSQSDAVENVIKSICSERNAPLTVTQPQMLTEGEGSVMGQEFSYRNRKDLFIPLAGDFQARNATVALDIIDVLKDAGYNISEESIRRGLKGTAWPGRFEVLRREPLFIVDGAHNVNGVGALTNCLDRYFPNQKLTFVVGVMADKDYPNMIRELLPYARRFIAVTPPTPRALTSDELKKALQCCFSGEVISAGSVKAGLLAAAELCLEGTACCACGSLYMVGEIRKYFGKYKN